MVVSTLLQGAEVWTNYRRHIKKLNQFHMRCLRKKWLDNIPNKQMLERCEIHGIEVMMHRIQLRWTGHVHRMPNSRLPKAIFYGQLVQIRDQSSATETASKLL